MLIHFQQEWEFAEPLPTVSRGEVADSLDEILPHLASLGKTHKLSPVSQTCNHEWLYGTPGSTVQATQSGQEVRYVGHRILTEWLQTL